MYVVENISDVTQRFHEIDQNGELRIVALPAGESGVYNINYLHGRFHRGALKATPAPPPKRRKAKRKQA